MKPLVSIIIPVYNGEKYIDSCLDGILNQTYENIEVIVVDDGSRDNTRLICERYSETDNRLKIIQSANEGVSCARNKGIQAANGEYIAFCDSDDVVSATMIEDNIELALKYDADVVMFCFWYYNIDEKVLIENELPKMFIGDDEKFFDEYLIPVIDTEVFNAPWNKLIKKNIIIDNQLRFNSSYQIYEDLLFVTELMPLVDKIVVNNKMYYKYNVRSSGNLLTKFCENYFESVTESYEKAIIYCNKYIENTKQIMRFNDLYVKLVMTHLKQISCNKDLSISKKYDLLKRICDEPKLIQAMKSVKMQQSRKKLIQKLVLAGRYKTIYRLYNLFGKLQGI